MSKPLLFLGLVSALLAGCAKTEKVPSNMLETISDEADVSPISEPDSADPVQLSADATGNQDTAR